MNHNTDYSSSERIRRLKSRAASQGPKPNFFSRKSYDIYEPIRLGNEVYGGASDTPVLEPISEPENENGCNDY